MSSAGQKYKKTKYWLPNQRNLIRLVKKYPIAYLASPKKITNSNNKLKSVWEEIASKLGQPSRKCKLLWKKIKLKYAKIMILINTGKITKEAAISHPETCRFFDGLLSFLDPYICDITDEDIPIHIHKYINDLYDFTTIGVKGSTIEDNCHFVTHEQVKSLLKERQLRGDVVDSIQLEYLQAVVDIAVKLKLEELMKNASSNPSNDIVHIYDEDSVNVTMMPNKNVQIVHKSMASSTLNPSENIVNKDEESGTRSINLGLNSELIIEDDIKTEDDCVIMQDEVDVDEDVVKEENFTLENNIINSTSRNFDQESSLPRYTIIEPFEIHNTDQNTQRGLNENAIVIEDSSKDMSDNAPPVTDEYLRNFFSELGVIMSMELSLDRQKILKSRINELLKSNLLKEH